MEMNTTPKDGVIPLTINPDKENSELSLEEQVKKTEDAAYEGAPTASRNDLQLSRRLFHVSTGTIIATVYLFLLERQGVITTLGAIASTLYIIERVRINYPEFAGQLKIVNKLFLRAEEQLEESSSVPYAMGILLTIITFPKIPAIIAIYTLAMADPLAAIVGIRFGKTKIMGGKSLEGSFGFFTGTFLVSFFIFHSFIGASTGLSIGAASIIGVLGAALELIPLRIDDNLTIPLYTAVLVWGICSVFGIPVF